MAKVIYILRRENRKKALRFIVSILSGIALCVLVSCDGDDIDEGAYYTFTGETVASFCENEANLSVFSRIIQESGKSHLLSVYGHYTCFAPTDSAFNAYFREEQIDYDKLTTAEKQTIVYNHLINFSREFTSLEFEEGRLPQVNMSDRFISISYVDDGQGRQLIYVNKNSRIIHKDNEVHNGVVHIVDKVVRPAQDHFLSILQENGKFDLFAKALEMTGLWESMLELYDESYVDPYPGMDYAEVLGYYPIGIFHRKKLGYTVFAETDETLGKAGIATIEQLIEYAKGYYGSADLSDYSSRNNPLNKFVSYHLLNRSMATNTMIYMGPQTTAYAMNQRHEYYETMLDKRLIEIKASDDGSSEGVQLNTQSNKSYVGLDIRNSNLEVRNGYIHALSSILVYDENIMRNDVLNKRLRIDPYAIPPEITNNNIRWQLAGAGIDKVTIPPDFCGENLSFNEDTKLILWASNWWSDYQADEMSFRGWYDFTFRLPPVPPGTYEIRLGYSAREWGGVTQVFFDGNIVGIPIDFYTRGTDPSIGWVADASTSDGGIENDKMMRNRGYMKGGNAFCNSNYSYETGRNSSAVLRIIVGTYTFQDYDYHYFRARNVQQEKGEFHCDYFEIVPVSYLDKEGID